MKNKKGRVYIVGAGPGDPELISVKGLRAIKRADCILYDLLCGNGLLKYAKKNARKICVGKADGLHLKEQGEINKLLYENTRLYKFVVRLKGADPFLFSRGIEEALYLKKKGIAFEVVPGITSAFAAPESFGIPLTRKGRFSSVAILTGRKSNGKGIDAPDCDTLVYLMAVANIREVAARILESGRARSTPCAFIERATLKDERVITGNLANIADRAQRYALRAPAVLVVGKIVNYGKRIYGHKYPKG